MNPWIAFICAAAISVAVMPGLILILTRRKAAQVISTDAPATHQVKKGTPTMGGIAIVLAASIVSLAYAWSGKGSADVLCLVGAFLATSLVGFLDDYLILSRGRNAGQKWSQKLLCQLLIAAGFLALVYRPELTRILLPGSTGSISLGLWWFPLAALYLTLFSNAVNLTDGLDGLAGGLSVIACFACAVVALAVHRPDLAVFALSVGGGCLGFLWFNCHPAKIFMGNTSSIALGMAMAGVGVLTRHEILLLLPFGVFAVEAASVLLQVGFFKLTARFTGSGRRIFLKAPIHHHFEMQGWKETQVVGRFWIIGLALAVLAAAWLQGTP